jgi:tRNA A-37 threonylcarbamoyl transferase component Bud32/FixJ family two-component response regulator
MHFIIVDESPELRTALGIMLCARWPDADLDLFDPTERDALQAVLDRGGVSALLLQAPFPGEDVVALIRTVCRDPKAPPVLLLSEKGSEELAVRAMKAGAADFLPRRGLTQALLGRLVEDALAEHEAHARVSAEVGAREKTTTLPLDARELRGAARGDEQLVPGYRILGQIGEGGMSRVYLAEREHDGLELVLKLLDPALWEDKTFLQRFVQEYKIVAALQNEYVARIYDQGFAGRHPYIAMEYFPGGHLRARIQGGISPLEAARITAQIARALDAIHGHNIVHRDLKPQNILFRADGRPAIVDFGLAKDLQSDADLTRGGVVYATARYMSPEQVLRLPVDARSDLYSLGAVFYEMLTGRRLYEEYKDTELLRMHVSGPLPTLPPGIAGFQPVIDRLLAKRPEDRFQSARELFATIAV